MLKVPEGSALISAPVKEEHAIPYAKKSCKNCLGRGTEQWKVPGRDLTKSRVCECAVRRFLQERTADLVMDPKGNLFYGTTPGAYLDNTEGLTEVVEKVPSTLHHTESRISSLLERLANVDAELSDIDARYAYKESPIKDRLSLADQTAADSRVKLEAAQAALGEMAESLVSLERARQALAARISTLNQELEQQMRVTVELDAATLPHKKIRVSLEEELQKVRHQAGRAKVSLESRKQSLTKRLERLIAAEQVSPERVGEIKAKLAQDALAAEIPPDVEAVQD